MTTGHPAEHPAARPHDPEPGESHLEDAMAILNSCVGGRVLPHTVVEAVTRVLAAILIAAETQQEHPASPDSKKALLTTGQAAELLGVSRMTVIRMADEGLLPSVLIRQGKVQKTRRIPRAFIDRMLTDASASGTIDMLTSATHRLATAHTDAPERRSMRGEGPESTPAYDVLPHKNDR